MHRIHPADNGDDMTWRRRSVVVIATSDTVRRSISRILARVPFDVRTTDTAADGLRDVADDPPDLVIVECGASPEMAIFLQVLRAVCRRPIMVVGEDVDEGLRSLESGAAADYMQTPVWERELRARAVHHAGGPADRDVRDFGEVLIDLEARTVRRGGLVVELTPREFDLLEFLTARPGSTFTREELLERVWGSSSAWQRIETVSEHVYRLRRKLEVDPSAPRLILTLPRAGYCFRRPDASASGLVMGRHG